MVAEKFDNSDIKQKIVLRNELFNYPVSRAACLEFFSGAGTLRRLFWQNVVDKVVSVDKANRGIHIDIVADSFYKPELSVDYEIIDCDAYGQVIPLIAACAEMRKSRQLYFFTDGGEKGNRYKRGVDKYFVETEVLRLNPADYKIEQCRHSQHVKYGLVFFESPV